MAFLRWILITAAALAARGTRGLAESSAIPAPPDGVVESGAPPFVVIGAETLGLATAPTDLHLLPDGRILVVTQHEIAIGDGSRWETYEEAPDQSGYIYDQVAVDKDGRIYAGIPGAIARIDLGEDAHWRFVPVLSVPGGDPFSRVIQLRDTWLWGPSDGIVVAWRPGQAMQVSRMPSSVPIDNIFAVGAKEYASTDSQRLLYQIHLGGEASPVPLSNPLTVGGVTSSVDYEKGQTLVGTARAGLQLFEGLTFNSTAIPEILGNRSHINDVCQAGPGFFAAAVDSTGIVFFQRGGHVVQVLTRALDHRLTQVHSLVYAPNGVLWALLDNAVARVQFPSPISDFEPLITGSIGYVKLVRHQGKLWAMADRQLLRGVYSPDNYLEGFKLDMPPVKFLWAIAETGGTLFASSQEGIFVRDTAGWKQIAAGIADARIGVPRSSVAGRTCYVARNETGWFEETDGKYLVHRMPLKQLGEVFNAVEDSAGTVWLELGRNRVGRLQFVAGKPSVRIFGKADGIAGNWPGLFVIDGIIRCTASGHLMRFDQTSQRFVPDGKLTRRIPAIAGCTGRPARDAAGRLWFARHGGASYVNDGAGANPTAHTLPIGFEPTEFTMESDGVVWMHAREHLIRFDPRIQSPTPHRLQAEITSAQLAATNRNFFAPGLNLPPLAYSDNSLVVRFCAVANPFGSPVSFQVMLEGGSDRWISTGNVGSASFNRLKEGAYAIHVRPVMAGIAGQEATLHFTIRPPWFRTNLARVIYVTGAAAFLLLAAWFISYVERRERGRLKSLVAERTGALAASEERFRSLNAELEARVASRTAELSITNSDLKREIAEHKLADERVRRLNRTLSVLSDINQAIVRERDLMALHKETCRIAVEKGGFKLAWIGRLEPGAARVTPLVHAGESADYIEQLDMDLSDSARAAGPTGDAVRTGSHAICNDIAHDPKMAPWRDAALRLGYRSSGAFPLRVGGQTVGAVNLYSSEPGFFDDEELTLLDELAMDLSFAIEHAEAEAGRRQAEGRGRHLAAFPELNPNPVLEFAGDGTLAYANPAAHALSASFGNATLVSLLPPGTREIVVECLAKGQPLLRLETRNDGRTISWSFYPIASQGTVHCYAGDITDRLLLEERLRQSQKMEAIGQLAGGVAHDFNNLLTVIQGHCELLLTGGSVANPEMMDSAKEIQAAAIRAANLTRQLLTFSRRQPMEMRLLDLDDVVSNMSRMLQRLIGDDIVLHTRLLPGGAQVEGDSGMFEQVLLNLAVNARDAMPGGGELWLELDDGTFGEAGARRHPRARPGAFVCLSLRDTGGGIAPAHIPHIFEPFFTTKALGKGTGLGLATVHGIVEQHRGWIEVESALGNGTTFRVYLPRVTAGASKPDALHEGSHVRGGNESILVVEDESAVRALTVKILTAQGYRVQEAPTGAAALEMWRRQPGAFDLVLTDLIMPGGVSGAQLGEQLRNQQPRLRIIYMSGYRGGMSTGDVGANFLQKPFDPAQLTRIVRAVLDS